MCKDNEEETKSNEFDGLGDDESSKNNRITASRQTIMPAHFRFKKSEKDKGNTHVNDKGNTHMDGNRVTLNDLYRMMGRDPPSECKKKNVDKETMLNTIRNTWLYKIRPQLEFKCNGCGERFDREDRMVDHELTSSRCREKTRKRPTADSTFDDEIPYRFTNRKRKRAPPDASAFMQAFGHLNKPDCR